MKHVVFVSGGLSSFATLYTVFNRYGKYNTIPLFTDTLIEDPDLYRFLLQTIHILYAPNKTFIRTSFIDKISIPDYDKIETRKKYLEQVRQKITFLIPDFVWLSQQMTPFDVFKKVKYMGNSRIDPCSAVLKRDLSNAYIKKNFKPDQCVIYLGFDQDEPNRINKARNNWEPYKLAFPIAEQPWLFEEAKNFLAANNIQIPDLYTKGFAHNNCGGFCVKQGQKGYANLLHQLPERFDQFAAMEQDVYNYIGKKHPFIKKQTDGVTQFLTLDDFKTQQETSPDQEIDLTDASCSCFV